MNREQPPPARHPEEASGDEIRVVYTRAGFPGPHRHSVRSTMEAEVCTRLLTAFRRRYGSRVFLAVVARHQDRGTINADAADLIVDLRDLDSLAPHLPILR